MSDAARKSPTHYAIGDKNPNLPFHPAVRAGDYIFVSGQVPKDENNDVICGTIEEETLATLKAQHDEEMQSLALTIDGEVDPNKFMPWVNDLVQREGPSILRSKGILALKGEDKRFVFQGVHMILDGDLQRDWKPDEKRVSRIVFIGRNLKEDEIREGFMKCAA